MLIAGNVGDDGIPAICCFLAGPFAEQPLKQWLQKCWDEGTEILQPQLGFVGWQVGLEEHPDVFHSSFKGNGAPRLIGVAANIDHPPHELLELSVLGGLQSHLEV